MTLQIPFSYPRRGLSGEFATFRLGLRASQTYLPGSVVELIDSRSRRVLLSATVTSVFTGELKEMASRHAAHAHNWKEYPALQRSGLLIASVLKRYPPGSYSENSNCSVIFLKEINAHA